VGPSASTVEPPHARATPPPSTEPTASEAPTSANHEPPPIELAEPQRSRSNAAPGASGERMSSQDAAALTQQAQRALDHGNASRATELARRAAAADPESPEAWLTLGAAYDAAGSRSLARTAYRSCVETGRGTRVAECRALLDH
jgi:hypothetical protein